MCSIEKDKLLHSFYGSFIYACISFIDINIAIISVVIVSFVKEIIDYISYKKFDIKDILATNFIPTLMYLQTLWSTILMYSNN